MPRDRVRRQGACNECVRRKRKCDQGKPICSQCRIGNRICKLTTFKPWKKKGNLDDTSSSSSSLQAQSHGLGGDSEPPLPPSQDMPQEGIPDNPAPRTLLHGVELLDSITLLSEADEDVPITWSSIQDESQLHDHAEDSRISEQVDPSLSHNDTYIIPFNQHGVKYASNIMPSLTPSQVDLGWLNSDTFLWSYFVHRTTKIFLCWDPDKVSSGEISDDPFAKVLLSLAVSSTPVKLAALGLAAFMYHEDFGDTRFQLQASRFRHQALQSSCNAQLSPVIHARSLLETVITMLLLILFSQDGRPSMLDIAKGAAIRMLDSDTRCYIDDMYLEVAMHLLRWCEICAQCSLRDTAQPTDQRSHPIIEFDNQELETRLSRHFGTWVVHPLYSFSHRWINPLLRLGRLVRLRRSRRNTDEPFDTEALTKQVDDLEEDLLTAREADLIAFQIGSGEYPDLLYLNEAMHSAIVILFYSRLRDLSWTSPLIRKHVRNVYEQLAQINQYSRTLNNAIFPLYAAGCEAVDLAARQEIEARITHIHPTGYWFNRETKLVSGLRHVWTVRDNDPGHGWMEWSQQVLSDDIDFLPV